MKLLFLITFISISLVSCQKETSYLKTDKMKRTEPINYLPNYNPGEKVVLNADYVIEQDRDFVFELRDYPQGVTSILNTSNFPSWASIDLNTGHLSGESNDYGVFSNIQFTFSKSNGESVIYGPFSIGVKGDPLKKYSWGLRNFGQEVFSFFGGTTGMDVGVDPVHKKNILGRGVLIAISDTGAEKNHDDYYENFNLEKSKNYELPAPYFGNPSPLDPHGTSVAGIISAKGWNNIGSRGVAPESKISVFQFLFSDQTTDMLIDQASGDYDVFNYSYGDEVFRDVKSSSDYLSHLRYMLKNGRDGKGSIFVKGAGNSFYVCSGGTCASHNANIPLENESTAFFVIGAINSKGYKASYSSSGSNIWVTAPGGEYGIIHPAIMTTDLPTCEYGYSADYASLEGNEFEYGHSLNQDCLYTSMMNGTSAAAPFVSGAIALLLEAEPSLSVHEIRYLLAKTSVQIDKNIGIQSHPHSLDLAGHEYEQDWIENAAGYKFHNWYGFGLVNVDKAIEEIPQIPNLGTYNELNPIFDKSEFSKTNLNLSIPDANPSGALSTIEVNNELIIEQVQIQLTVDHSRSGEVGVELISPQGTKSQLLNINHSFLLSSDKNLDKLVLTSNSFYGESSQGGWTIKIIDGSSGTTGKLKSWKINITGFKN
ncbi:S8 family serine peptidase [Bacteriovoracaceae bacterium]|nr:S8 family serine peptidase [Bacteriovoracaceae bacterium]